MLVTGFFFAAVSGNLVGMIGSSNNPISGLTLATTIVAALTMVIVGVKGVEGVAAVLGVAAVVCVSSAVAGEMLQDLKVGHILGGTPVEDAGGRPHRRRGRRPRPLLPPLPAAHRPTSPPTRSTGGFGGPDLSAPQAGLMAALSQGIVGGEMAWPLVIVGIAMGISLILVRVKSPMLFSVGMYLPLETTFAIFVGGLVRGFVDRQAAEARLQRGAEGAGRERRRPHRLRPHRRRGAHGPRAVAAVVAWLAATAVPGQAIAFPQVPGLTSIARWLAIPVMLFLIVYLARRPLAKAGAADEPAPPTAVM